MKTSTITVDFKHLNDGSDLTGGQIPDGIVVNFNTTWGRLSKNSASTVDGEATTIFQADGKLITVNPVQINALADDEVNVNTHVQILSRTTIDVTTTSNFAGQKVIVTAIVRDEDNMLVPEGNVIFTINGKTYTVSVHKGQAILSWTIPADMNSGTFTNYILVKYDGKGTEYASSSCTSDLTVDSTPTSIQLASVHNFAGQNVTLTATVRDYYGNLVNDGQVTFTINCVTISAPVINGKATLTWTIPASWKTGTYTIKANYNGTTTNYMGSTGTANLTVDFMPFIPTKLSVDNAVGDKSKTVQLKARLTDNNGNPISGKTITFKVNGKIVGSSTTNNQGLAVLNYTVALVGGNYTISAEFTLNKQYMGASGNGVLKVPQASLYIKITPNKTNLNIGENILITVKVGNNGPDTANGVIVSYTVPKGFKFVNVTHDAGLNPVYNAITRTVTWNLGDVPVSDPYMYITLKAVSPGTYNNIAKITSENTYDPDKTSKISTLNINIKYSKPVIPSPAVNTTNGTIPMQKTGVPLTGLIVGMLSIIGGIITTRKR